MKAVIRRGKFKGREVEISQWCNDWFSIDSKEIELATKPFPPTSLAFTMAGIKEIRAHKNNGMLFQWYEPCSINGNSYHPNYGPYSENFDMSFRRKK